MSSSNASIDKSQIADLVAKYGSSSATAWLEFERYLIWTPSKPIPESSFTPVQGYMQREDYVFAWGNPLVSDPSALGPTAAAFKEWVNGQDMKLVWACVDEDLEQVLAEPPFEWAVVECIYEDVIDPSHVIDLTSPEAEGKPGGASVVKDLKKNLRKAEKADVRVEHVDAQSLSEKDKKAVEDGIGDWKKARNGVQMASTTLQPWLDAEHRRYWLARQGDEVVGILILAPIHPNSWQIKNAVSFPDAPKGTSESLIYTALVDLQAEKDQTPNGTVNGVNGHTHSRDDRVTVTFGISAAKEVQPVENLSGWRISMLSKVYKNVSRAAGLVKRGEFRKKFDGGQEPMFVCYPQDKFGLEGVDLLIKCLKK